MARYSISNTTLTALGDSVRRFAGDTRIESIPYDKKQYQFDSNIYNSVDRQFILPTGGASKLKVVRISCEPNNATGAMYWDKCDIPGNLFPGFNYTSFEVIPDAGVNEVCFYSLTSNVSYTFEVSYFNADGQPMTIYLDEEVVNTLTPGQMAEALNNYDLSVVIPESELTITGDCNFKFAYGGWDWFITQLQDKITTKNIKGANSMFYRSKISGIPFDINLAVITDNYSTHNLSRMFYSAENISTMPMIYNAKPGDISSMFYGCHNLTYFPKGFAENWDWSYFDTSTSSYDGNMGNLFGYCKRLRAIPKVFLLHGNPYSAYSYSITYSGFTGCFSLEKLEDVFIAYKASYTGSYSNSFSSIVSDCFRLKKFTLMTQEDGTPYTVNWNRQIIDLTTVGFCSDTNMITGNTDFTTETKIDTIEKWHGYIDGSYPDGWANDVAYSTFGATAVKELLATLPTTSGTGCTIKLKQGASNAVPREEMTSLTEEDIAVATAKGWTITFV